MAKVRLEIEFESIENLAQWAQMVAKPVVIEKSPLDIELFKPKRNGKKQKIADSEIIEYIKNLKRRTTIGRLCRHFGLAVCGGNWNRIKGLVKENHLSRKVKIRRRK